MKKSIGSTLVWIVLLTIMVISGCAPALTPEATSTPAPPTFAPTSTYTPAPTNTPTATFTSTPTPMINLQEPVKSSRGIEILSQGKIAIGIRHADMYPMIFQDGGDYKGFEIDLAIEITRRLFGDQVTIDWIPLRPEERIPSVESGQVDFLIRNMTHTISRESKVLFTSNYFLDGVRLLVRKSDGYQDIGDLNGKTIGFADKASVPAVQNAAKEAGVEISVRVDSDFATKFNEKQADAIAVDWTSHGLYVENYNAHQAIANLYSSEPLAILVSLKDPEFRDVIDSALLGIIGDGTWQTIYDRWFPEPPPWTVDEMLTEPPKE